MCSWYVLLFTSDHNLCQETTRIGAALAGRELVAVRQDCDPPGRDPRRSQRSRASPGIVTQVRPVFRWPGQFTATRQDQSPSRKISQHSKARPYVVPE